MRLYHLIEGLFIVVVLVVVIVWSTAVYRECRQHNSVSYCLRLASR